MTTRIIGIDFGTSTTVVRVHNVGENNRVVPVAVNGSRIIPTIAFKSEDGNMYYGYDAQMNINSNAKGTIFKNFKMDLISEDENVRAQAENLIQGFLRYVFQHYQNHLNAGTFDPADSVKVYVSHPAKWNSYARTLMKTSVVQAGFCKEDNVLLKDEPTAAILAVIHEKKNELSRARLLDPGVKYKAMMIDMGAGTTDIVLCTYKVENGKMCIDDIFTHPSINTPGLCGGREIDEAIVEEAEKFVGRMEEKPSAVAKKTINKMRNKVKEWKEQTLSRSLSKDIALPEPDEIADFRDFLLDYNVPVMNERERFDINRKSFEQMTHDHWKQWGELLSGAFQAVQGSQYAHLNCPKRPEEVDLLIITGGHSKWYIVPEFLLGKYSLSELPDIPFSKIRENADRLLQSEDPQETVAVGLCFLDEDVVGKLAASNDITMSFICEGNYIGSCELVKKGVELPFKKDDYVITSSIKGNFLFRNALVIEFLITTDNKNTVRKSVTVPAEGLFDILFNLVFALIGGSIFVIYKILKALLSDDPESKSIKEAIIDRDYVMVFSPDLFINEEGIIRVGGTITVDTTTVLQIPEFVI